MFMARLLLLLVLHFTSLSSVAAQCTNPPSSYACNLSNITQIDSDSDSYLTCYDANNNAQYMWTLEQDCIQAILDDGEDCYLTLRSYYCTVACAPCYAGFPLPCPEICSIIQEKCVNFMNSACDNEVICAPMKPCLNIVSVNAENIPWPWPGGGSTGGITSSTTGTSSSTTWIDSTVSSSSSESTEIQGDDLNNNNGSIAIVLIVVPFVVIVVLLVVLLVVGIIMIRRRGRNKNQHPTEEISIELEEEKKKDDYESVPYRPVSETAELVIIPPRNSQKGPFPEKDFESWEIKESELEIETKIGEGEFGEVFKGQWRSIPVASKK